MKPSKRYPHRFRGPSSRMASGAAATARKAGDYDWAAQALARYREQTKRIET